MCVLCAFVRTCVYVCACVRFFFFFFFFLRVCVCELVGGCVWLCVVFVSRCVRSCFCPRLRLCVFACVFVDMYVRLCDCV